MPSREKIKVFLSHIHEEEDVAQYLKDQIERCFLETIDVFVAGDYRSIEAGADWFNRIVEGIKDSQVVFVLVSSESASRPFINFEAGGAWLRDKKVIPLCHNGMIPESLPEPMRRLQAIDLSKPDKVESLFSQLAGIANIGIPRDIPFEDISQRITKGNIPLQEKETTPEKTMYNWINRPGSHLGEEVEIKVRIGDFERCPAYLASGAEIDPTTSLKARIHQDPVDYRPFWDCVVTNEAADLFESKGMDSWVIVTAKLVNSYEKRGYHSADETIYLPLIVIEKAREVQSH